MILLTLAFGFVELIGLKRGMKFMGGKLFGLKRGNYLVDRREIKLANFVDFRG